MALLATMMLTSCGEQTRNEMLVGKWTLERAIETVTPAGGAAVETEMPGYAGQTMELMEEGTCCRTDRGVSTYSLWYLADDRYLIFTDMHSSEILEDYTIDELTKDKLVYSDAYIHYDSLTGNQSSYAYLFEYSKD